jgi:DNA-binding NtrC family response regulator
MVRKKIVLVEDDRFLRQQVALALGKDYEVLEAGDRVQGEKLLIDEKPELCILDLNLPPTGRSQEGIKLIEAVKREQSDTVVIVMSGNDEMKVTLKAMEAGAYDYFKKPFDLTELKLIIHRALEKQEMERENERLQRELRQKYAFQNIIGQSSVMLRVFEAIKRVADTSATVIIRGESGTGKELIARAIHYNSRRSQQPFISVNCAALPETLVETELFGHERGAFTGAVATHTGRFELADQGTLFLDEIGSVTLAVQAKLLRVLQDRRFERGGTKKIETDVRLITATNEDLEKKVQREEFREDLYYRIHVFPINVPPLRERREDIPLVLDHFLRLFCHEHHIPLKRFEPAALEALTRYSWKGNVRELENLVQTLVLMTDEETIRTQHLPSYIQGSPSAGRPGSPMISENGLDLDSAVQQFEKEMIRSAIQQSNGKKTKAAELLKIDKNRMKYLCRKYKI